MLQKVLIYADSNTWGDNFITGQRIPDEKQWVNILRKEYQDEYVFFQEGLSCRVAGREEKIKPYKNGQDTFIQTFITNAPVDIIIISLGTNDLQIKYHQTSKQIIQNLLWYTETLKKYFEKLKDRKKFFNDKMPHILYILPINFDYQENASKLFDYECENKRNEIIDDFKNKNIDIIVANDMELLDGIHLSYKGHEAMAELVKKALDKYQ